MSDKVVAEREHSGGLLMRILKHADGMYVMDPVSANRNPYWQRVLTSAAEAKAYADERLSQEGHDCEQLGCGAWFDRAEQ